MSEPKLISPMLDDFIMGDPISEHHGVRCCPALRQDSDSRYIVKIISVPASQVQLEALLLTGAYSSKDAALAYFREMAEDLSEEAEILKKLSSFEGFLPYEDHQIEPMTDGVGFDVYLLSPYKRSLTRFMQKNPMTHLKAVNMGLDLCASMAMCRRAGYMYVDLKPNNIFVNEKNEFCIGDLGFVRMDSLKYASLPDKYRSPYTAPEIADAMSSLNTTVDIYAIGKILYEVYNDGKLPTEAENASLPAPIYADYEMAQIILKACDPNPAKRWQDPLQMGQALVAYMQRNSVNDTPIVPMPEPVFIPTEEELPAANADDAAPAEEIVEETVAAEPAEEVVEEVAETALAEEMIEDIDELPEGLDISEPEILDEPIPVPADIQENLNDAEALAILLEEPEVITQQADESNPFDAIDQQEDIADLSFMEQMVSDETVPQDDDLDDFEYDDLSDDASDILSLADELIAHETPEPVVAPEPIDIPIPEPIDVADLDEQDDDEIDEEEAEQTEEDVHRSLSEELEAAVIAHEQNAVYDDRGYDYVEDEDDYDDDDDDDSGDEEDAAIVRREREKKPGNGKLIKKIVAIISVLLVAGALFAGAYYYYNNYYLQTIDELTIVGSGNQLTVQVVTDVDNSLLTVECTDTYGTVKSNPVQDGQAIFNDLNPNTLYTVRVSIDGFHELVGDIAGSYTTPAQTKIISFNAIAGSEDGSVILNFTVDGQDSADWIMEYSTEGEEVKQQSFTGHMVTISGLTLDKTYTFRITSPDLMYIVGKDSLTFTATSLILAQNLTVTGCNAAGLTAQWDAPEGAAITNWIVRCYNDTGYDETVNTTENSVVFTGIDPAAAYTVEVTAEGMTVNSRAFVSANSATISDFAADYSALTKLTLTWKTTGVAPADGWLLMYTRGDSEQQEVIRTNEDKAVLPNPIPGESYRFLLQASDGTTVFDGSFECTMPAAPSFTGYSVSADKMTFSMCLTPDKVNWTRKDVKKDDYTTTFTVGQKASYVVKLSRKYLTSSDIITTMFLIRDSEGNIVSADTSARSWTSMWYQYYCELDVPALPDQAGEYTMQIYFNGMIAHEQAFTVTE